MEPVLSRTPPPARYSPWCARSSVSYVSDCYESKHADVLLMRPLNTPLLRLICLWNKETHQSSLTLIHSAESFLILFNTEDKCWISVSQYDIMNNHISQGVSSTCPVFDAQCPLSQSNFDIFMHSSQTQIHYIYSLIECEIILFHYSCSCISWRSVSGAGCSYTFTTDFNMSERV